MEQKKNQTTLSFTTEIGTFGSMPIQDPTVQEADIKDLAKNTKDKDLQKYLEEQIQN